MHFTDSSFVDIRSAIAVLVAGLVAIAPRLATAQEHAQQPSLVAPGPVAPSYSPTAGAPGYLPPPTNQVPAEPYHGQHAPFGDGRYRSPGLAVALSLQPLPIDFGNLYAENLSWGVAYTAIEVALMTPMMWVAGQHMGHGYSDDGGWSGMERGAMLGLFAGYVAVKLVAGLHAGYAAQAFNRSYEPRALAFVAPAPSGALLVWAKGF